MKWWTTLRRVALQPRHALRLAIKVWHMRKAISRRSRMNWKVSTACRSVRIGSVSNIKSSVITCVFAGPRKWIYEVFQSRLLE